MRSIEVNEPVRQRLQRKLGPLVVTVIEEIKDGMAEHTRRFHAEVAKERRGGARDGEVLEFHEEEREVEVAHDLPDVFSREV